MKKTLFLFVVLIIGIANSAQTQESNPYDKLKWNLDGITNLMPGWFTIFRDVDINFANGRFSRYLEGSRMNLTIDDKSVKWQQGKFATQKFVKRVSSTGKEYLTVTYTLETSKTKVPYYPTDDGSCDIITKVKITGTAELVIKLFLDYWPTKLEIGGYKPGDIASYTIMGDYIALVGENQPNICTINITKGNIEFDYYTTFDIKAAN